MRREVDGRQPAGGTLDAAPREGAAAAAAVTPRRRTQITRAAVEASGEEVDIVTMVGTGAAEATGVATVQAAEEDGSLVRSSIC